ncbi:MAG TPA: glycosyltransferase [Conexibacter sp.]|nr:glycosyltransferase [Conexibacter sp.]
MPPRASVIVRAKDSGRTVGRTLALIRAQTVAAEIVVVDSGSSDETLAIARAAADQVVEIPAERFSFGRALNVGAAAAEAPIHFALSSHVVPPDERWIERSLAQYARADVAGTSGAPMLPGSSEPLTSTFHQTLADALAAPYWGFSNTASSWRAAVWQQLPFDEQLQACEDKEWALRALAAGWTIAVDPTLRVADAHRHTPGLRHLYRRTRREAEAIASFVPLPPATLRGLLDEWWSSAAGADPRARARQRLSPPRLVDLLARFQGQRATPRG